MHFTGQSQQKSSIFRVLKRLRSLYDKQCGPRSDCSYSPEQSDLGPHCLFLYLNSSKCKAIICDRQLQMKFSDAVFVGALNLLNELRKNYIMPYLLFLKKAAKFEVVVCCNL